VIITREDKKGWDAVFREFRELARIEVTADDLVVWFSYSDEPWSIREFKHDSPLYRWLSEYWQSEPLVCVTHKCFVPCRRGKRVGGCDLSIEEEDVVMVREWQARG